nr:monocopper oxidase-like protein SKU5 [Tanacetum cinerariifolium]
MLKLSILAATKPAGVKQEDVRMVKKRKLARKEDKFFMSNTVTAINGKFPGPTINSTTDNNVVVNARNQLDEDLLLT